MSPSDVATWLATLAAFVAIIQTARANRLSRKIAAAQGELRQPNLSVSLVGLERSPEFAFAVPLRPDRWFEMLVTLAVKNTGDRTARDVSVFARIPRRLLFGGTEPHKFEFHGPGDHVSVKSVAQTEHIETLLITIPVLHPGVGVGVTLSLSLGGETYGREHIPVRTADGHEGTATVFWTAADVLEFIVAQADQKSFNVSYHCHIIDTTHASAADFFRQLTTNRGKAKRRWWQTPCYEHLVKVYEIPAAAVEDTLDAPIRRLKPNAKYQEMTGFKYDVGYLIPALDVFPSGFKKRRLTSRYL